MDPILRTNRNLLFPVPMESTFQTRRKKPQMLMSLSLPFSVFSLLSILLLCSSATGLHPPQCQWDLYQDVERLRCVVEPGNSLIVEEEVNGIGPEHAKSLWVHCNPERGYQQDPGQGVLEVDSYFGSEKTSLKLPSPDPSGFVLSHGVFMAVPNLRDLRLESCRILGITPGSMGYLPYLQNLTIRAGTSLVPWSSSAASSLEIKPGVLRGLPELRYLDLSTTSLSSLPTDFLCYLPALNYLNLTGCALRDFRSIGIAPADPTNPTNCGNQIRTLDLSFNHFSLLPPATFSTIGRVEELRLEANSITSASERALLGLSHLKVISLAMNRLSSLQPEFFQDNRASLKEIYLQNNSLAVLAPGLFSGMEHLVVLDLSNNELTSEWVNGEIFRGLVRLVVLNIAHNDLTRIDSLLFKNMFSLQVLNLENNQIASIAEDAFSTINNLHTLLLSHNKLKAVDNFICNGLFVLSFLALDNNKIERVGPESFRNCSNGIMDLNLSGNKLTEVPAALSPLTLLRTLDLGENLIVEIGNASYQSLPNLYGLRLTDNKIRHVPNDALKDLPSLKIVNFAKNNISSIEAGTFDSNSNLQAVRLDSNRLSDVSNLFKKIPNLLWLNISANLLETLNYSDFPPRLQWLDLRSNLISTVGNCLEIDNLRIRNLDVSHNRIKELSSSNLPDSIENLVLSFNNIHQIQPYTFFRKSNLTRIDLSHNELVRIDQNSLRLSPGRLSNGNAGRAEIFLGHNPLICDCSMEWLQNLNSGEGSEQYPIIQDVEDVKCSLAHRGSEPISYDSIQYNQFLCKYDSHCVSGCQCCDFDHCDCSQSCPQNCSCFHDQEWSTNVVDCSLNERTSIPDQIPMDVTELFLDGNYFGTALDSHSFLGRRNLKKLFLNASHIDMIHNRTFHGLSSLNSLHLENNYIERLEGFEFSDLEGVEEIYLHQNKLSYISNQTFAAQRSLRILTLHSNNLVEVAIWSVTQVAPSLKELTLHGNDWSCECQFANRLKEFLYENSAKIIDVNQVNCVDAVQQIASSSSEQERNGGEQIIVRLLEQRNHKCSTSTELTVRAPSHPDKSSGSEASQWSAHFPVIFSLLALSLILLILALLAYYWRRSLRVWFHANCGLRLETCREPHAERDKLFDAFVSYSSKDEAWVRQVFAAELERSDAPYRLCLRYRDLPTSQYVADSICQAAEASRRTILVLSHHFLKGEWSRTDVKTAHHSVLKDRHRRIIIILLGDLPSKDLDPDIRLYLKNHTYLHCDDKKFWDKLRYALPDVRVKSPLFRGASGRNSNVNTNGGGGRGMNLSMPPPPVPPPHYQHQYPLPPPPTPHHPHPSSNNVNNVNLNNMGLGITSSHHHLLNSASNHVTPNQSANNTLRQHNLLNALNSHHPSLLPPNILPLVSTGSGSFRGQGGRSGSGHSQGQYQTIVSSNFNGSNPAVQI